MLQLTTAGAGSTNCIYRWGTDFRFDLRWIATRIGLAICAEMFRDGSGSFEWAAPLGSGIPARAELLSKDILRVVPLQRGRINS